MATVKVCSEGELGPGEMRLVEHAGQKIGVFNCDGDYLAIEDRCSHDDGPLAEGPLDCAAGTVECPRHGSVFDLRSGRPKSLPAYQPVEIYPVRVVGGEIVVEVGD